MKLLIDGTLPELPLIGTCKSDLHKPTSNHQELFGFITGAAALTQASPCFSVTTVKRQLTTPGRSGLRLASRQL